MSLPDAALAALVTADGRVVGSGFMVANGQLLTCAHVVNVAMGAAGDEQQPPDGDVLVEFPLHAPGRMVSATVVGWVPIDPHGAGDVALLRLTEDPPAGVAPAPLTIDADTWGHSFRSYGFPVGHPFGLWATGRILGAQRYGWVQLEDVKVPGAAIERGFSGGAVFDESLSAVVGMIVAQDLDPTRKTAFMLSGAVLAQLVPDLATVVTAKVGSIFNVPRHPPHYQHRSIDVARVSQAVLTGMDESVDGRRIFAILGMGGAGKSVLAAAVARDPGVRRAFPDGVAWLELGPLPALPERQAQLAGLLGVADAAFADAQQGRARLASLLGDRRCLIVLDNVWHAADLAAFDVLGPRCALLLTTRDGGPVRGAHATRYELGLLDGAVAAALLAQWAGVSEDALPPEAMEVIQECGGLPLALSMVGAMMQGRPDGWPGVLRRLRQANLDKIRQSFPHYPYPDLLRAIEIGTDALPTEARDRYIDLAVFAGRRFPPVAAEALWVSRGLDDLDTADLLHLFAERSLARWDIDGYLTLHDLQADYVRHRAGDGLAALHDLLLDGYAMRAPRGWPSGPADGYYFEHLLDHLVQADRPEEAIAMLLSFDWLSAKLAVTDVTSLLADFESVGDAAIEGAPIAAVRDALRLGSSALTRDPNLLAAQIVGRLTGHADPAVQELVAQARDWRGRDWLRPVSASLTAPGGPLRHTLVGHTGRIRTAAVTTDGRLAVSGAFDGTVRIWDLETGAERKTLHGHTSAVWSVAVTPDNRHVLSGSIDGTVRVWELASGAELAVLAANASAIWTIAVTPDGQQVISGASDGTVRIWSLTNRALQHTLRGHSGAISAIRVSADGTMVASKSEDGSVRTWQLPNGEPWLVLDSGEARVQTVSLALSDRYVLAGGELGKVQVWDRFDGRLVHELVTDAGPVWSIATSPDSRRAVIGSQNGSVTVWDLDTGSELHALSGHTGWVEVLAITPDGQWAVSGADDAIVRIWDVAAGVAIAALRGHAGWLTAAVVASDGRRLVTGSTDMTLRVWDLAAITAGDQQGHSGWINHLATVGDLAVSTSDDSTLRLWNITTAAELAVRPDPGRVTALAISPDGRLACSGGSGGRVSIWPINSAGVDEDAMVVGSDVTAVDFIDGQRVAAGTAAGDVHVREIERPGPALVIATGEGVQALGATAAGSLVVAGARGTLSVWDTTSWALRCIDRGPGGPVLSLTATPDGRLGFTGCIDGLLSAWDLASGDLLWETPAHDSLLQTLTLVGDRIASGGGDGLIRLWNPRTGHLVGELTGAGRPVRSLSVSADGRWLASGAGDSAVLWDVSTGTPVARFDGDSGITAVTIVSRPAAPMLICGEATGNVHVLDLMRTSDRGAVTPT